MGDVACEIDDKVPPVYCTLLVVFGFVTKISCGLLAALIPVVIVAEFEDDPSSSSGV